MGRVRFRNRPKSSRLNKSNQRLTGSNSTNLESLIQAPLDGRSQLLPQMQDLFNGRDLRVNSVNHPLITRRPQTIQDDNMTPARF